MGFTIVPRKSRKLYLTALTYLDFADDIALLSNTKSQAKELLLRIETACTKIGLHLNTKNTKVIFNPSIHLIQ